MLPVADQMPTPISADATVSLTSAAPKSAEELEQLAVAIADSLDGERIPSIGPAVGVNLRTSTIEALFSLDAATDAAVHEQMAVVIDELQSALGVTPVRSAVEASDSHDVAPC